MTGVYIDRISPKQYYTQVAEIFWSPWNRVNSLVSDKAGANNYCPLVDLVKSRILLHENVPG